MSKVSYEFTETVEQAKSIIQQEMERRSYLAANVLRNKAQLVLRGQRSGRRYKVPGTYRRQKDPLDGKMKRGRYYTASAPGEPPAVRTGTFRASWQATARSAFGSYISRIESDVKVGGRNRGYYTESGKYLLGDILEDGTSRMAPRPYQDRILKEATPAIVRIYQKPYFNGGGENK